MKKYKSRQQRIVVDPEKREDMEDLLDLRSAKKKEGNTPTVALDQLKRKI